MIFTSSLFRSLTCSFIDNDQSSERCCVGIGDVNPRLAEKLATDEPR